MSVDQPRRDFISKTAAAAAGLVLGVAGPQTGCANADDDIRLTRDGRTIRGQFTPPVGVGPIELRIHSQANASIFEYDDVSPYAPASDHKDTKDVWIPGYDERADARRQSTREQRFPVVDVALSPEMEAVIEFDQAAPGVFNFNARGEQPVAKQIRIPSKQTEHWANSLIVDPKSNSIQSFYLAWKLDATDSPVTFNFEALRDDWEGDVSLHDVDSNRVIARASLTSAAAPPQLSTGEGVDRKRMIEALSWTSKFILGCEDTNPESETHHGEFLLYDLAAKTRMRPQWCWAWGPSAKVLLEASKIDGVQAGVGADQLRARAVELGQATLDRQILDSGHPAYGVIKTSRNVASTVDSLFLVGWGWIPLYEVTGDKQYLEAADKIVRTAERLMDEYDDEMIPQSYHLGNQAWADIMSFESSMGLPGLAALYRTTGNEYYRDVMIRLADLLTKTFEKEDGLWGVFYSAKTKEVIPTNYWTKALGYCVDGLIEAHRAAPNRGYLDKGARITAHVLAAQAPDGSWSVRFDRSPRHVGTGDKATALWAGLLIRLYKLTGEQTYLAAGTKALEWCMDHQYFGPDSVARGGIVGRSWASGITFRHWFDVVVTYTSAFFGASLIEALSLDEWKQ